MESNGSSYYRIRPNVKDISKSIHVNKREITPTKLSLKMNEMYFNKTSKSQEKRRKICFDKLYKSTTFNSNRNTKPKPLRLIKKNILHIKLTDNDNELYKTPLSNLNQYQKNRAVINRNQKTNKNHLHHNTNIKLSSPLINNTHSNSYIISQQNITSNSIIKPNTLSIHPYIHFNTISSYTNTSPNLSYKHSPLCKHHSLSSSSRRETTHSQVIKELINLKCKSGVIKGKKLQKEINRNSRKYYKLKRKKNKNEYYIRKEQNEFKKMCLQSAKQPFQITTFHNINNKYSFRTFNEKLDYLSKISERMAYVDRKRYFEDVVNFKPDPEFYFNEECNNVQHSIERNKMQKQRYHKFILDKRIFQAIRLFHLNKKAKEKLLQK